MGGKESKPTNLDVNNNCDNFIKDCNGNCEEFRKCACNSRFNKQLKKNERSPCNYHPACLNANYCNENFTNIIEGNVGMNQGLELGKLISTGEILIDKTEKNANTIDNAVQPTLDNQAATKNAAIESNFNKRTTDKLKRRTTDTLLDTISEKKLAGQFREESSNYRDKAEQDASLAEKQKNLSNIHQKNAKINKEKTQESQKQVKEMQKNTESDVQAMQSAIGMVSYSGNANYLNQKQRKQNDSLKILQEISKMVDSNDIEQHIANFTNDGIKYLNTLEDNKIDILVNMFLYYKDYYENSGNFIDPLAKEKIIQLLDYIIENYKNNGIETNEYNLYIQANDLKKNIATSKQSFSNIKEYFTNLIEGNTGMSETTTDPLVQNNDNFVDSIRKFLHGTQNSLNIDKTNLKNSINNIKRYQDGEFLAQRDTIMNNVLMDYMINNKEGSNIEQVYGKLNQEKNDKLRKTKITSYYTKSFKEYIYLLKIVIFLTVLMIPILIFNRLEILNKSLTLLLVVTIITLGFLYISYRLYILYMRDSKDFDKFKIPFTRTEAARLKNNKSRYSKDSPLKSLGITCVGEECCDESMIYDKLRDKCVATENFGNYFENAQQLNNQQKNIIKENNSHEDESNFAFLGGNANIIENFRSKEEIKQKLLLESLTKSSLRTF